MQIGRKMASSSNHAIRSSVPAHLRALGASANRSTGAAGRSASFTRRPRDIHNQIGWRRWSSPALDGVAAGAVIFFLAALILT
jgi:hypothetical protein